MQELERQGKYLPTRVLGDKASRKHVSARDSFCGLLGVFLIGQQECSAVGRGGAQNVRNCSCISVCNVLLIKIFRPYHCPRQISFSGLISGVESFR